MGRKILLRALPLATCLLLLGVPVALGDEIVNNIDTTLDPTLESVTIANGGAAQVGFFVRAETLAGDANGCNSTGSNPATVTLDVPSGVTASPTSLTFTGCGIVQNVGFSSSTAGNYTITVASVTGGKAGSSWDTTPASFVLHVLPPADSTPPVITNTVTGNAGSNGWYTSDVTVAWSVTDPESAVVIDSGCGTQNFTAETAGTTSSCSAHSAGGSASNSFLVKIDETKPTISASLSAGALGDNGWYVGDVTVHFTCHDDLSGVVSCPGDQILSAEGASVSSIAMNVTDVAGNVSDLSNVVTVGIDKTKPTIIAEATTDPNAAGWYNTPVTVHFTCTDGGSGIAAGACPADQVLSTEGVDVESTAETVTDQAGNISEPSNIVKISLDSTKPTISAAATTSPNSNGWYKDDVVVVFTCADNLSGIPAGACPNDQTLSTEGTAVASTAMTVTDTAGNTSDLSNVVTVKIDKTKPTITATFSGTLGQNGWYVSNVTVHFTCSDTGSGVVSCPADQVLSAEGDSISSTAQTVTDLAGNVSDLSNVVTVKIDKTAPTNVTVSADRAANAAGWYNASFTATWAGSDATSGIAWCTKTTYSGPDTDSGSISGSCADVAGNTSADVSFSFKYDATAPVITITSPSGQSLVLNASVLADYSCSDATSGIDSCVGTVANGASVDTSSIGSRTFTVNATDSAGNSASTTVSYAVVYSTGPCLGGPGHQVLQPLNPDGSSVFKQKSTVPIKFRVCDANGVSIGTPGVVGSFRLVRTISGTVVSTVDEAVDSTTPDTAFRWSPTDQQWIFNLSTKLLAPNVTYVFRITLNDTSYIDFQFGLR